MKIVALDSETLSQKTNAVILEVAAIAVEVKDRSKIDVGFLTKVTQQVEGQPLQHKEGNVSWARWPFNLKEQVELGRDVDGDTLKWHCRTPDSLEYFYDVMSKSRHSVSLAAQLDNIREFCSGADEIWINGLSFDPTILKTLCEALDVKFLWPFRWESDVRSFYKTFDLNINTDPSVKHTALGDCVYNLAVVHEVFSLLGTNDLTERSFPKYGSSDTKAKLLD